MIIVVGTFAGIVGAIFVSLAWVSLDLLLGTHTLTEHKVIGVICGCVVLTNATMAAMILFEEFRN